jgi:hypothetical protein
LRLPTFLPIRCACTAVRCEFGEEVPYLAFTQGVGDPAHYFCAEVVAVARGSATRIAPRQQGDFELFCTPTHARTGWHPNDDRADAVDEVGDRG